MTWANRFKLLLGLIITLAIVAACTIVFNQRQHLAQSTSASILAQTYPVGTDYGGIVTNQFAQPGEEVKKGQALFEVRSPQLQRDITLGYVTASDTEKSDGTVTVTASVDGTLNEVSVPQGGYVQAGSVLASIYGDDSLFVEAKFLLSPRDYARITDGARVDILMPNQETVEGEVVGIDVATDQGAALSTVRVSSDDLEQADAAGLFQPGTPVQASLALRDDGPLAGVSDAFADLMRQIGL